MRKTTIIRILVLAGALAVWDLLLKTPYYDWAGAQEPLASNMFGTAMLGYGTVFVFCVESVRRTFSSRLLKWWGGCIFGYIAVYAGYRFATVLLPVLLEQVF